MATQTRFHRDVLQWSRSVISALIFLQDTNDANGGTKIIPSSQYFPFVNSRPGDLPKHAGTWLDEYEIYDGLDAQALTVSMLKGEILLMDSLVFHTPTVNTTANIRYAVAGAYYSSDELVPTVGEHTVLISGIRTYCGNEYNWE